MLCYDVRPSEPAGGPVLVMIGSPMGAAGFGTLATHFTDRTIVTYDPRGVERSERADLAAAVTPDVHAADVRAVIEAVGGGPVDVRHQRRCGQRLALVATEPGLVSTVAHEPPCASLLPDATEALAACRAVHETYQQARGAPWRTSSPWSRCAARSPPISPQPAPDPAMFGMPTEDDGSRRPDARLEHAHRHRVPARRRRTASVVDEDRAGRRGGSDGELAHRGAVAVADLLGTTPVTFPGDHGGFLGGEYGQTGEPEASRPGCARSPAERLTSAT